MFVGIPKSFAGESPRVDCSVTPDAVGCYDGNTYFCKHGVVTHDVATYWLQSQYGDDPVQCVDGCKSYPGSRGCMDGECWAMSFTSRNGEVCTEGMVEGLNAGGNTSDPEPTPSGEISCDKNFGCGDVQKSLDVLNPILQQFSQAYQDLKFNVNDTFKLMQNDYQYFRAELVKARDDIFKLGQNSDAKQQEILDKLDNLDIGDVDLSGVFSSSDAYNMQNSIISNIRSGQSTQTSAIRRDLTDIESRVSSLRSGFNQDLSYLLPSYLAAQTNDIVNALSGSGNDVDLSPLEGKIDGLADDVGSLDGSIKDGVDTLTGAVNGVKDAVDSGFSGLGEKLDGIINGNGNVFSSPTSGGWSAGTVISDGVTGIQSEIEGLQAQFEQLVKNPPMLMGVADFNGGSYDGISFDVRGQRVSFNLFGLLGNNTSLISSIIIFIATLMAAFIILSAGRNKE